MCFHRAERATGSDHGEACVMRSPQRTHMYRLFSTRMCTRTRTRTHTRRQRLAGYESLQRNLTAVLDVVHEVRPCLKTSVDMDMGVEVYADMHVQTESEAETDEEDGAEMDMTTSR